MKKKQYMVKKGRRSFDNNGFESPMLKAYWKRVDAEAAEEE